MTARINPLMIYLVRRDGQQLTLHSIQVIRETPLSYYVASHDQWLFGYRMQIPKTKAHRSMKAAWSAMRNELIGHVLYHRVALSGLKSLLAQLPKGVTRFPRKKAA